MLVLVPGAPLFTPPAIAPPLTFPVFYENVAPPTVVYCLPPNCTLGDEPSTPITPLPLPAAVPPVFYYPPAVDEPPSAVSFADCSNLFISSKTLWMLISPGLSCFSNILNTDLYSLSSIMKSSADPSGCYRPPAASSLSIIF